MKLPTNFTRDVIMKAPTADIMGSMTRSILTLGSYDKKKDNLDIPNVLRQSMQLIATFPMIAAYAYHAYIIMRRIRACIFTDQKRNYL